ncbi:MAG: hypothetical protein AAB368_10520 [bacterium]
MNRVKWLPKSKAASHAARTPGIVAIIVSGIGFVLGLRLLGSSDVAYALGIIGLIGGGLLERAAPSLFVFRPLDVVQHR